MPCVEWFEEQDQAYRDSVLPPSVKARVAVEAGIGLTWYRYVGDAGRIVSPGALRCLRRRQGPVPRVRLHRRAVAAAAESLAAALSRSEEEMRYDSGQNALQRLSDEGVAIWLDDLSRKRLTSGNLRAHRPDTWWASPPTRPSSRRRYRSGDGLRRAARRPRRARGHGRGGRPHDHHGGRRATRPTSCAALTPPAARTAGSPSRWTRAWPTTPGHVAEAKQLAWLVDRPNILIKIPATKAGLPAITEVIGRGISVNVTLIFSLERYREVMDAYLAGLEKAKAGRPGPVRDPLRGVLLRLPRRHRDRQAAGRARHRRGQGPQGQGRRRQRPARLQAYEEVFAGDALARRWDGARRQQQRPLWASTGVKDPAYKDTLYVDELVAPTP